MFAGATARRWVTTLVSLLWLAAAFTAPILGNAGQLLLRHGSGGSARAAEALFRMASRMAPGSHAYTHGLARALAASGRDAEAVLAYSLVVGPTAVSRLEEGRLLVRSGSADAALGGYLASGVVDVALENRRLREPEVALSLREEAAIAMVAAGRSALDMAAIPRAEELAARAVVLAPTLRVQYEAAEVSSLARERQEDVAGALAALLAAPEAEAGARAKARHDRLARLWLSWFASPRGASRPGARLYRWRCLQWLGDDRRVAEEAARPAAGIAGTAEADGLARCLQLESHANLGRPVVATERTACGLPSDGETRASLASPVSEGLLVFAPVAAGNDGLRLSRVVANPLDVDLGLPVSADFYYSGAPPTDGSTEIARIVHDRPANRVANGGFELEGLLGLPADGRLPVGFERTIESGTGAGVSVVDESTEGRALRLADPRSAPGASAGIVSCEILARAGERLFLGARVRSMAGQPFFGSMGLAPGGAAQYDYVEGLAGPGWTSVGAVRRWPAATSSPRVVLQNFRGRGVVWFDRILVLPAPDAPGTPASGIPAGR